VNFTRRLGGRDIEKSEFGAGGIPAKVPLCMVLTVNFGTTLCVRSCRMCSRQWDTSPIKFHMVSYSCRLGIALTNTVSMTVRNPCAVRIGG